MAKEEIKTVNKSKIPKGDDKIETHDAQKVRLNPKDMPLGDLICELVEIPHGVYQHQAFTKRRKALQDELNERGPVLKKKNKK